MAWSGGIEGAHVDEGGQPRQPRAEQHRATGDDIARSDGFLVHASKTRLRGHADRQLLAGLVVNHHPATPRDEYDQLRAILHNATRTGLAAQNRTGHPDFAQYLIGRVTWVSHHHPARAVKLATLLAHALAAPQTDAARQLRRILARTRRAGRSRA
ncbi:MULTISPECIES: hypothetical protein [Micromonospora]|uniref:hypothetical protein n=1 Tax=Micromonospora TaxID=1873 RepID=UPI001AE9A860|nr:MULTISPECIES: hypothetical protein [unclassified Micromonospora]MBP1780663.1 hypothetical protein [Micromonospora sp. HB375]MDH6468887.1 hypothetical protein [Micromonospora sp. H404/HB375]